MDLFKIEQLNRKILKKEEHVLWLRSIVDSAKSPQLKEDKIQTSIDTDKMSRVMSEIIDEERELEEMKSEYLELQVKVLDKIERIDVDLQRKVLKMKYLDFKSLPDIGEELHYSYEHIRRTHKKALQNYKKNERYV